MLAQLTENNGSGAFSAHWADHLAQTVLFLAVGSWRDIHWYRGYQWRSDTPQGAGVIDNLRKMFVFFFFVFLLKALKPFLVDSMNLKMHITWDLLYDSISSVGLSVTRNVCKSSSAFLGLEKCSLTWTFIMLVYKFALIMRSWRVVLFRLWLMVHANMLPM